MQTPQADAEAVEENVSTAATSDTPLSKVSKADSRRLSKDEMNVFVAQVLAIQASSEEATTQITNLLPEGTPLSEVEKALLELGVPQECIDKAASTLYPSKEQMRVDIDATQATLSYEAARTVIKKRLVDKLAEAFGVDRVACTDFRTSSGEIELSFYLRPARSPGAWGTLRHVLGLNKQLLAHMPNSGWLINVHDARFLSICKDLLSELRDELGADLRPVCHYSDAFTED